MCLLIIINNDCTESLAVKLMLVVMVWDFTLLSFMVESFMKVLFLGLSDVGGLIISILEGSV